jgi:hypothetical protein
MPSKKGPWLVSLAMWSNFLRCVTDEGVPLREVARHARVTPDGAKVALRGMSRWGYVVDGPSIRPTKAGRRAAELWPPLLETVEARRQSDELLAALADLVRQSDIELPSYLPLLRYSMRAEVPEIPLAEPESGLSYVELLAKALLMFTLDYETQTRMPLAIAANFLRPLGEEPIRSRDLPMLSGVAREVTKNTVARLQKLDLVTSGLSLSLTPDGIRARNHYRRLVRDVERQWRERFGAPVAKLRSALESAEFRRPEPYPDGWRATVPQPAALPDHPLVLHRGGYPDGS